MHVLCWWQRVGNWQQQLEAVTRAFAAAPAGTDWQEQLEEASRAAAAIQIDGSQDSSSQVLATLLLPVDVMREGSFVKHAVTRGCFVITAALTRGATPTIAHQALFVYRQH